MQEIVDQLNLRSMFDTEDVRDKLKMAGLRGQAPLVTYMFFRVAMPIIVVVVALALSVRDRRLRLSRRWSSSAMAIGAGYLGFYLPNVFIENLVQRARPRSRSLPGRARHAADLRAVGHVGRGRVQKVSKEVGSQSLELAEELSLTTAELSYLQDRRQAFENLGKRTGIAGIKAVAPPSSRPSATVPRWDRPCA